MKRIIFAMMVTLLLFSGAAYGKTYNVAIVSWIAWGPANVADVKGFWQEQGIDVRVVTLSNPIVVGELFRKNRVDIILEMIGAAVGMYMEGLPVIMVSEIDWSHGGDKIIIRKGVNPADLKGEPVGIFLNQPSVTYFLNQYLSAVNLKISDIQLIEMENPAIVNNFIAGRFKAAVCFNPDAFRAEKEGNGIVAATTADYEGCNPECIMMMKETLKDMPKDDLAKILKGWIKGVQWSKDEKNWKEYVDILNNQTFKDDPPYSENKLKEILNTVRIHDVNTMKERNQDGGGLEIYLKNLKDFLKENNMLKKEFNPKDIFDNTVIMEVLENEK